MGLWVKENEYLYVLYQKMVIIVLFVYVLYRYM